MKGWEFKGTHIPLEIVEKPDPVVKPGYVVLKTKAGGLVKNVGVLKKILRLGKEIGVATAVTAAMPKTYDPDKVLRWVKSYNACFKH